MLRNTLDSNALFLVTGAGGGIGRATTELLLSEGYRVAACDLDVAGIESLCSGGGDAVRAYGLDVRDVEAWRSVVEKIQTEMGPVDVLVNNAGICNTGQFDAMSDADLDVMLDVNVYGVVRGMRAVMPKMRERGAGHVVNIASLAGVLPLPGLAAYSASKHAVRAMTHSATFEMRGSGISCTAICPGPVETPMLEGQVSDDNAAVSFSDAPLKPAQIAAAILRAARERPVEIVLPATGGNLARAVGSWPMLVARLITQVQRRGRAGIERRRNVAAS